MSDQNVATQSVNSLLMDGRSTAAEHHLVGYVEDLHPANQISDLGCLKILVIPTDLHTSSKMEASPLMICDNYLFSIILRTLAGCYYRFQPEKVLKLIVEVLRAVVKLGSCHPRAKKLLIEISTKVSTHRYLELSVEGE